MSGIKCLMGHYALTNCFMYKKNEAEESSMTSTTYSQDMCAVLSQSGREDIYDLSSQDMAGRSIDSQTSQIRREERDTALWPGGIKDKPGIERAVSQ